MLMKATDAIVQSFSLLKFELGYWALSSNYFKMLLLAHKFCIKSLDQHIFNSTNLKTVMYFGHNLYHFSPYF